MQKDPDDLDRASLPRDVESPSPANETTATVREETEKTTGNVREETEKSKPVGAQEQPTLKQMLRFARNYWRHDIGWISTEKDEKLKTTAYLFKNSKALRNYSKTHTDFAPLLEVLRCRTIESFEDENYQRRLVRAIIEELEAASESQQSNPYWYPRSLHCFAHRTFVGKGHSGMYRQEYTVEMRIKGVREYRGHILRLSEYTDYGFWSLMMFAYMDTQTRDWNEWFEKLKGNPARLNQFRSAVKLHRSSKGMEFITPEKLSDSASTTGNYCYVRPQCGKLTEI